MTEVIPGPIRRGCCNEYLQWSPYGVANAKNF